VGGGEQQTPRLVLTYEECSQRGGMQLKCGEGVDERVSTI
jgi:hypothetical protein